MTEDQKKQFQASLAKQAIDDRESNRKGAAIEAAVTRLASAIVERAVNSKDRLPVPPWADAQARASQALKSHEGKPLAQAEADAGAQLATEDAPKVEPPSRKDAKKGGPEAPKVSEPTK